MFQRIFNNIFPKRMSGLDSIHSAQTLPLQLQNTIQLSNKYGCTYVCMHDKKWRESKVEIKVKKMKLNFYENQKGDIN